MEAKNQLVAGTGRQEPSAFSTFPHTATHGARDKRCYHGKPENGQRIAVKRNFGGELK